MLFKYTMGIASFFLILFGFYYLIIRIGQGEFYKFESGVTILVNNSSKQELTNLNFFFSFNSNYDVHQDLGNIDRLEPGKTTRLYSRHINGVGNDRSLYLQYPINNNERQVDSLAYLASYKPGKVVIILEIIGVDNKGKLLAKVRGYEDVFGPFEFEMIPGRN